MQFKPEKPAIWIDSQSALDAAMPALAAGPYLAVDTESNSLYAYREQVCLIQCTTAQEDYLIDTLDGLDLSALGDIFADNGIQKIFHAAEYDVICMRRDFGFEFENLFDTMQAARILGFQQLGLASMLENQFRLEPVKSFQKANWGKRPLSPEMKQYARVDTHYLIPLRERLAGQLENNELSALAEEDFRRVRKSENNHNDQTSYTQVRGYHKLPPDELAVLDALCKFRDRKAAQLNRPHFKVIGSTSLLAIAREKPQDMRALENVEGLSPRLAKRFSKGLLAAVKKGMQSAPIIPEKHIKPSRAYVKRLEELKLWRKEKGKQFHVPSDVILPRDILEAIAGANPATMEALRTVMADVPVRYANYGEDIFNRIRKGN